MAEIVNLRRARKARTRQSAAAKSAGNRAAFGQSKARRKAAGAVQALEERRLDAHRREQGGTDEPSA
jgi:hypothetical protein